MFSYSGSSYKELEGHGGLISNRTIYKNTNNQSCWGSQGTPPFCHLSFARNCPDFYIISQKWYYYSWNTEFWILVGINYAKWKGELSCFGKTLNFLNSCCLITTNAKTCLITVSSLNHLHFNTGVANSVNSFIHICTHLLCCNNYYCWLFYIFAVKTLYIPLLCFSVELGTTEILS